jgi:hypothetical protein
LIDVVVLMEGRGGKVTTLLCEISPYPPDLPYAFCAGCIDCDAMADESMADEEWKAHEAQNTQAPVRGDDPEFRPRIIGSVEVADWSARPAAGRSLRHSGTETLEGGMVWLRSQVEESLASR